jgi:hypothetical protein
MGLEGEPAWHGAWIPALAERPSQPIGRKAPSRSPLAAPRSPFGARLPGRVFRGASLQRLKLLGTASRLVISGSNARGAIPRTFQPAGWAAGIPSAASAGTSAADAER